MKKKKNANPLEEYLAKLDNLLAETIARLESESDPYGDMPDPYGDNVNPYGDENYEGEQYSEPIADSKQSDEAPYDIVEHNCYLVDTVINNTLTGSDDITGKTANTLLKLITLKKLMQEC